MKTRAAVLTLIALYVLVVVGCSGGSSSSPPSAQGPSGLQAKAEHPEGDPNVSADAGGPGFTGEGWTTAEPSPGAANAKKGGTILTDIPNWPENLRVYGTGSNTYFNSIVQSLIYESLLEIDENTLEFVPSLATHWWISEDQMTFRFRINPRAHWSDGEPVVAEDVVATWKLLMDDTLLEPMGKSSASKLEEPVAKSKYIVEIRCKERDWRNFIFISGTPLLPAHEIGSLTGKAYLDDYNFKYTAVNGPYVVLPDDIKDNESITVTRREDYWAADAPRNQGRYNFDKMRWMVVRDRRLAFDKTSKGELDFHAVYTAQWWVEDLPPLDAVKKGHLIRQKVYTKFPEGIQGLAFNMRKPPLDDIRIRKALAHLWNRREALEKFAFNEYDPLDSYYPGSESRNPNNKAVEYDPAHAVGLLEESGWTEKGPDGIRVKDGQRLSFVVSYNTKGLEKYFTSYKESCKAAGVEINLNFLNPETLWKNVVEDRTFEIASMAWAAVLFPNPRPNYHSSMADSKGSNNITGLKNPEVDRIIEVYDQEFDLDRRTELLRELDGHLFNSHHYALAWWLPSQRLLYWNKFGMPDSVLPKYVDWRGVFIYWWADPDKAKKLSEAKKSGQAIRPLPDAEVRGWIGKENIPAK